MFVYPVYKAIKQRLNTVAPVFFFLNQYAKGKENTSYKVPAIYIETPKNTALQFYGRQILTAKGAQFKIHYISYAPFKNHDNPAQDSAIQAHEIKVEEINELITGWNVTNEAGKLLTQQFIPVNANLNNYFDDCVVSIITYQTEVYKRSLQV